MKYWEILIRHYLVANILYQIYAYTALIATPTCINLVLRYADYSYRFKIITNGVSNDGHTIIFVPND